MMSEEDGAGEEEKEEEDKEEEGDSIPTPNEFLNHDPSISERVEVSEKNKQREL